MIFQAIYLLPFERQIRRLVMLLVNLQTSEEKLENAMIKGEFIGQYTALHGPKCASLYFEKQLHHTQCTKSTCRKFHDAYKALEKKAK